MRLQSRYIALIQGEQIIRAQTCELIRRRLEISVRATVEECPDLNKGPDPAETTVANQQSFLEAMMRVYCLRPPTNNAK